MKSDPQDSLKAFCSHDHRDCSALALAAAHRICAEKRLRLTPVRQRALEILLESHKAIGAYDVLQRLNAEGLGSQPPIAYRALEFLVSNGLAHRIEKLNAYVACMAAEEHHNPTFWICRKCRSVAETFGGQSCAPLSDAATSLGFSVERMVVEVEGLCNTCRETGP
ncbi:MAG: transcriptional repressor [Pseudomonadota bacterium]